MMAALNDTSVKTDDTMNTYIKTPCGEKVYTILEPEFGMDEGNMVITIQTFYVLKSTGASFQNHLAECMQFMGYKPCLADQYRWMRTMKRLSNGFEQYEYVLIYVDNVLSIGDDPTEVLQKIDKYFGLYPGSQYNPSIYLGENLKPTSMNNG